MGENARVKRSPAVRGWLLRAETDLEQARQVSRSLPPRSRSWSSG
ncbi:hypothetical protein ACFQY4_26700 [Catellatospora bangladeshensis]